MPSLFPLGGEKTGGQRGTGVVSRERNALRGLKGKIAAVTGAGSGIGQAAAKRLAEEGCSVAILEWKEAAANDTLTLIKAAGGEATAILVDVGNEPQVEAAFKRVL